MILFCSVGDALDHWATQLEVALSHLTNSLNLSAGSIIPGPLHNDKRLYQLNLLIVFMRLNLPKFNVSFSSFFHFSFRFGL